VARVTTQLRRPRRARRQVAEINVVPYIDVMLVLLVIFMITAPLLQTGVEIDLPDAAATPIANDGGVLRLNPNRRVLVAGDKSVDYGQIMQAMVTLQISGAPEIGLMSDPSR